MAVRASSIIIAGLLVSILLGCNRGGKPHAEKKPEPTQPAKEDPAVHRLVQTFDEATRKDPPAEAPRPPDMTVTGKSVGKLYADVVRLWKDIPFKSAEGKRIDYSATLETESGNIEMALLSDLAPNHVRNFVALARAGYYDGLSFDRVVHETIETEDKKSHVLDLIEGGDPLGAADTEDQYSIGYWLKPEIDPATVNEEGSVGAVRGAEIDSAGCKFYIVLSKLPPIPKESYTVFGKVTQGLDIARKIHQQPVVELEEEYGYSRPLKPVIIRKVTINTYETDTQQSGENKQQ